MPIKIEVVTTPAPPAPRRFSSTIQVSSLNNANTNGTDNNNNNTNGAGSIVIGIAPPKLMPIVVIVPPEEAKEAMKQPSETIQQQQQQQQRFRPSITKKQLEHEAASTISMAGPIMDRIKAGNEYARKTDILRSSVLSLSSHSSSHSSTGTSCSSSRSVDGIDEDGRTPSVVVKVFQRKSSKGRKKKSFTPKYTEESLRQELKEQQDEEEEAATIRVVATTAASDLSIS
jgi:hypothetical protein